MIQTDVLIRISDSSNKFKSGIDDLFTNYPSIVIIDEISNSIDIEYPIRKISIDIPPDIKNVANALIDLCNETLIVSLEDDYTKIPNID